MTGDMSLRWSLRTCGWRPAIHMPPVPGWPSGRVANFWKLHQKKSVSICVICGSFFELGFESGQVGFDDHWLAGGAARGGDVFQSVAGDHDQHSFI